MSFTNSGGIENHAKQFSPLKEYHPSTTARSEKNKPIRSVAEERISRGGNG
jgi:hypothetical protein